MAFKQLKLWFDKDLAILLSKEIKSVHKKFDDKSFISKVDKGTKPLELKDRVELMADELGNHLGMSYSKNVNVLLQILGPENEEETGMFKNFYWIMPIAKYVEKYGLENHELSMKAIEAITKRNTGEYTIRPYLEKDTKKTMKQILKWSKSKNFHVRRLASEGSRPKLPWAKKLQFFVDNPKPLFPILRNLNDDSSKYVQKSVANSMNDILKDNLELGKEEIESWLPNASKERKWIIKHALRNLKKKENQWALSILKKIEK